MGKEKSFVFDPRIFISKPYLECPKCHTPSAFGINWISGNCFTRRCRKCFFTESYKLPKLNKKVIYLDQFVISLMMKAINKKLGKTKTTDSFWLVLFRKIDRLLKLQLIICPDSTFHQDESAPYQFEAHRRMYEHLSNGSSFYDPGTIRRFQFSKYFRQMINRRVERPESKLERNHVIQGNYNDWQERIRLSVNIDMKAEELRQLKTNKLKAKNALSKLFEVWKTEKDKLFMDWFVEEAMGWGKEIVRQYRENISKLHYMSIGILSVTSEESINLIMSNTNSIIHELLAYLPETEDPDKKDSNIKKVVAFLLSEQMLEVPSVRIAALLRAALTDQFAHGGRKKHPREGIVNDINMVSTLLPYCDAMFIDREMFGLLNHPLVKKDIKKKYTTRIFSAANNNEFIDYLDGIENAASKVHLNKVKELYGEDWPIPFMDLYEYK